MALVALLTGATGQIVGALARQLALSGNYQLILACRNELKGQKVVADLKKATKNENISYVIADASDHSSIIRLRDNWKGPLHLLINGAAESPRKKETIEIHQKSTNTNVKVEKQFSTNVLGYYWFMKEFESILSASAPSRVVNIASYWAGDVDIDDLMFERRSYNNDAAYRQSKALERMLTVEFATRLSEKNVTVNVCHPGDVNSKLSSDLGFGGHETPEEGAATPLFLATDDRFLKITGKYYEHKKEKKCQYSKEKELIKKLCAICEDFD